MADRSVLLLATNKSEYLKFAINCAESIKLHNPGLPIFIATNIKPDKQIDGVTFLAVNDDVAKLYIEAKLYLDTYLQTEETLFIDSDCLCYDNLEPIFEACQGMDVTVIGRLTPLEKYWGTGDKGADYARSEFSIDNAILFNGGFYYIKKTALTKLIFDRAREISVRYDEYEFHRIKNKWKNEEDLLSIGMIANKQLPVKDTGEFMSDLSTDQKPNKLNVLKGERVLRNPANKFTPARSGYPPSYSPILVHFGGSNIKSYPYVSQRLLLKLFLSGLPVSLASLIVFLAVHIPYKTYHWIRRSIGLR
ncbi:hypothetical protein [Mucilaginibacter xinganensis]|uniref:Uncharacterized protein n=1 Tax=Mucilaginibacter xinganensis TaxID=1234841 RepID=A0A223P3U9_9SPHI|nr:hypothetical protein [Mucilaginibacter xinganensis]ASU36793.1 hypothetical protein MuYL_4910 [Mucilaginibacter xinganensis]